MVGFVHPVLNRTYIKQTTTQQDKLHRFIILLDLNSSLNTPHSHIWRNICWRKTRRFCWILHKFIKLKKVCS